MNINEKLGLGTVQFGLPYGISNKNGQTSLQEVYKILNTARSYKLDILDSASAYGNSESVIGKSDLSSFKIVSKFMPPAKVDSISTQLHTSLSNLRVESLFGYLAHRPLDILNHPQQWDELSKFKQYGKVKKIGFSLNKPEELEKLLEKGFFPDLVQVPYNYFDRRFEDIILNIKAKGCEIHTRSAFLQGLFFVKPENLNQFFDEVKPIISQLQQNNNLNGKLLKFVLKKPYIDKVIIGVENERQLVDNIIDLESKLDLPELQSEITDNILIPAKWPKN